ncbi:MAG: ATP synthase subunit I [Geminocystis sp.]|nr:ATP synthase subunit I [Geminocystis sp.]MCS7146588.1 ATP synthase subunit I [Geminocystis sp.]MCX8077513.1 ATP synthase subunit I [Geminocystis sp.]MDW8115414.1 ATP synthase subunit I [Geminocystis sp.]MDW8462955.1 ATP synthase subunit I [Geminocystis sp.]
MSTVTSQPPSREEKGSNSNSMREFYQLRNSLYLATGVIGTISFLLVWFFYGSNTALNFLLGVCFSLVYINMLAREVERVGITKKRIGATRLAAFAALMILATKWQQLQVIPIFLGFLSYKGALLFYILPMSLWENQSFWGQKG